MAVLEMLGAQGPATRLGLERERIGFQGRERKEGRMKEGRMEGEGEGEKGGRKEGKKEKEKKQQRSKGSRTCTTPTAGLRAQHGSVGTA